MTDLRPKLLWIDGLGAALVGAVVVLLHTVLSAWYRLPEHFVLLLGVVNLAYASYSLSLARRARRPIALIRLLVLGNLVWAVLCLRWAVLFWATAAPFGLVHLVGEGLYVGGLACLEWRWRDRLRTA
jgi:hypothetical protein